MLKLQLGLALSVIILAGGTRFAAERRYEVTSVIYQAEPRATIAIRIDDRERITVEQVSAATTEGGSMWFGTVQETGENALLMWWKTGRLTGIVGHKGRIYTITNTDGEPRAILEAPAQQHTSKGVGARTVRTADSREKIATLSKAGTERGSRSMIIPPLVKPFSDAKRLELEAKTITIDLMLLYTRKAASRYIVELPQLMALAVEQVNQSFRNSGLGNIRLRLVHAQSVDYNETDGGHFDHLYRMIDGVGPFRRIRALRDDKRADVVGLVVEDPSGCGLSTRVAPDAEEAYFVVHHSCAAIMFSIGHEVGHILGARHDRETDPINSPFPYGHGYVNGTKWRDIMSYQESCAGCPRIPYWSNPRIAYGGEPTGTASNDNARVILEQAERVAKFR